VPASSVRSEPVSFSSVWRETSHIISVLASLSCSLRDAQVFDALVTHYWQVHSHRPACRQLMIDFMTVESQRDVVSIWNEEHWAQHGALRNAAGDWYRSRHHTVSTGGLSPIGQVETNPLQTLEHQSADQERSAAWNGRPCCMPNLNPVGQERDQLTVDSSYEIVVHAEHRCFSWVASPWRCDDCLPAMTV